MRNMPTNRPRSSIRSTLAASQRRLKPEPEPEVKKFVKIILLSTIKEKMMKIPARFVRLGPKLTDKVTLETPVGFKCSIGIKRICDKVWLEEGWSEFAEAHSLSEGHFLYFHYKGKSCFRVVIFDTFASEIEYPLDKVIVIESDNDNGNEEVMDDDDEEGFTGFESSDDDDGVIDLDEFLKKSKPRVNIKSEKDSSFDDVIEID